ncbi:aminoglycoside phosphotransferase family protein [Litchfieldia alkalitelluris]|uniref:aminoglycoside phosphotransferase family protein n=1 Tax=Litchfieldia alkalitelluris TaxID=304268 RepID=UPI000997E5E6|nr:aminoglycoside phosphotransferase family protein [Litchfieldia alkalitelluris]
MDFQENFIKSIRLYFKEEGEVWLKKLPELIRYSEEKWKLKLNQPYLLSVNYVAPAVMESGEEVVVKICFSSEGFMDELEAMNTFEDGMAKLLDWDDVHHIFLLAKLSPGHTLAEIEDDEEACKIAADVMKKLSKPPSPNTRIKTTKAREEALHKIMTEHPDGLGPITSGMLEKALNIFSYLHKTPQDYYLLHGDFHHYNILSSGEGEWIAIDPKGLIGEREYDLIQYLLNKLPNKGVYEIISKRVEILTKELYLIEKRLLLWGYCHTVLATAWSVDDHGVFDLAFFNGIEVFERMFEERFVL